MINETRGQGRTFTIAAAFARKAHHSGSLRCNKWSGSEEPALALTRVWGLCDQFTTRDCERVDIPVYPELRLGHELTERHGAVSFADVTHMAVGSNVSRYA